MDETDLRLDGNAAAGLLSEVFAIEATSAVLKCASCGAMGAVGAVHAYMEGPGMVLRCPDCDAVVMRFARLRNRLIGDLRGVAMLSL